MTEMDILFLFLLFNFSLERDFTLLSVYLVMDCMTIGMMACEARFCLCK